MAKSLREAWLMEWSFMDLGSDVVRLGREWARLICVMSPYAS